jgi:Sec-independent protein translocase protein TatA
MNLLGPDMMVILLIVLLLFGAKNCLSLPGEWVGQSRNSVQPETSLTGNSGNPGPTQQRQHGRMKSQAVSDLT